MANSYATITQVKAFMPDAEWGTSYDSLLTQMVEEASRKVDTYLGRFAGAFATTASQTRYYNGNGTIKLLIDEITAAPTSVAVAETGVIDNAGGSGGSYTSWAQSDYYLEPYNAPSEGLPYTSICVDVQNGNKLSWYGFRKGVKITGVFGYATTAPLTIRSAVITQTLKDFERAQQGYKDVGAIPELGQLRHLGDLDPEVKRLLGTHFNRIAV